MPLGFMSAASRAGERCAARRRIIGSTSCTGRSRPRHLSERIGALNLPVRGRRTLHGETAVVAVTFLKHIAGLQSTAGRVLLNTDRPGWLRIFCLITESLASGSLRCPGGRKLNLNITSSRCRRIGGPAACGDSPRAERGQRR